MLDSSAIHRRSQYPFAEEDEYVSNHIASNDQNQAFEKCRSGAQVFPENQRRLGRRKSVKGGGKDALNGVLRWLELSFPPEAI